MAIYIKDHSCISPQKTYDGSLFNEGVISYTGNKYFALEPSYNRLIPRGLLRRMGRAVRIGIGAGMTVISKNPKIDGIIIGTANGGLEDCIKFLNQVFEYNEGNLTPTNFIQSTPNSVAGNLAIMGNKTGYNITHVHKGLAFENALIDAKDQLETDRLKALLVGNIEELSDYNFNIELLSHTFKKEEVRSELLIGSNTKGTVCGEGSAMFLLSSDPKNSLAQIINVDHICFASEEEILTKAKWFLSSNNLEESDIDGLMLGLNGDVDTDRYYYNLQQKMFPHTSVYTFKNLVGEYPTASSFATWLATQCLNGSPMPPSSVLKKTNESKADKILIYNHYEGTQHGFILLQRS